MPYRSNRELPQAVRDNYTERCQKVFRDVWNNDYSKNKNESRAFSIANTAAKNCMANTTKDKREINKSDEVDTESHIEKAGERVSVPSFVSANARRGLKMYEDGYGGDRKSTRLNSSHT